MNFLFNASEEQHSLGNSNESVSSKFSALDIPKYIRIREIEIT